MTDLYMQMVCADAYIMADKHEFWDDDTEMTPEKWVACVKTILQ